MKVYVHHKLILINWALSLSVSVPITHRHWAVVLTLVSGQAVVLPLRHLVESHCLRATDTHPTHQDTDKQR